MIRRYTVYSFDEKSSQFCGYGREFRTIEEAHSFASELAEKCKTKGRKFVVCEVLPRMTLLSGGVA